MNVAPALAEPESPPVWFGGADHCLAVWGEYERSGASWSYEKYLREPKKVRRYSFGLSPDPRRGATVMLRLHVWGVTRGNRYRPRRWSAKLDFEYYERKVGGGSCTSLRDAFRKVEALDIEPEADALLAEAYSNDHRVECVYRLKDSVKRGPNPKNRYWPHIPTEEDLLNPDNWEPFMTDLGFSWNQDYWPSGRYLMVHWVPEHRKGETIWKLRGADCQISGGSRSVGFGQPGWDGLAGKLGMWNGW